MSKYNPDLTLRRLRDPEANDTDEVYTKIFRALSEQRARLEEQQMRAEQKAALRRLGFRLLSRLERLREQLRNTEGR